MATRFATQFTTQAAPNLMRQFGETVTYKPHRDYQETAPDTRSISALVERAQIETFAEDGDTVTAVWNITVQNDSTVGISSDELNLGGDQISLPPRFGESASYKTITRLISHYDSMLRLECR